MHGEFQKLFGDRRGAISVLAAFVMVGAIGVSALAIEYGHGLLQRTETQRVADLAAYGGGLVYNSTSSTTSATSAVNNIAALNGLSGDATTSVANSPTGDGNQALQVTVTSNVPLLLARLLTTNTTMAVSATAYAEVKPDASGCVIALGTGGGGSGITLSGGTGLTADNCAVASNTTLTLTGGSTITTKNVDYDTTAPNISGGSSIVPPAGTSAVAYAKVTTADPLSGNTEVSTATARLATVASEPAPSAPTPPSGASVTFGYSSIPASGLPTGCTDSFSSPTHTLTCTGTGPFNFGGISLGGGITVNFNTGGSSSATYNFSGSINNSGAAMTFGSGTYNIAQEITVGGGTTTTFGAGTFNVGKLTTSCSGVAGYSICNTGTTLTFGGPSKFVLQGGIYNGGGATLSLGSGNGNSYQIGKAADGNSINAGTSETTSFVSATDSGDLFQTAGNIVSGGGTCLSLPAAAEHDINGYISLAGGTTLGAGIYTVSDYVAFGASGGGDVTCSGNPVGVSGSGVTLVIGGTVVPSSGTCSGTAFCIAAGFSHVTLTAPSSGITESLVVVGPPATSANPWAGATFAEGATNTSLSGAFYFPHGPVTLGGAATVGNGTGQCLELIGSRVALAGGSAVGSTCAGLTGGSSGGTVSLVQ